MRPAWILLMWASIPACKRPPPANTDSVRALAACAAALEHATEPPTPEGQRIVAHGCALLYAQSDCRDAWQRLDAVAPEARAGWVVSRCARAYCPKLSPQPRLCGASFNALTSAELASWPELDRAILSRDLGPAGESVAARVAVLHGAALAP